MNKFYSTFSTYFPIESPSTWLYAAAGHPVYCIFFGLTLSFPLFPCKRVRNKIISLLSRITRFFLFAQVYPVPTFARNDIITRWFAGSFEPKRETRACRLINAPY